MRKLLYTSMYFPYIVSFETSPFKLKSNGRNIPINDWLISLREIGKYDGDIAILFYGGCFSQATRRLLEYYKVKLIYIDENIGSDYSPLVYKRYTDIKNHIDLDNYDVVIHMDCDMWFQNPIQPLYDILPENGCVMGGGSCQSDPMFIHNENENEVALFFDRMIQLEKITGYWGVNGGFLAGTTKNFLNKTNLFYNAISTGLVPKVWGVDQFLMEYYFDMNNDVHDSRFNSVPGIKNDLGKMITKRKQEAIIVHKLFGCDKIPGTSLSENIPDIVGNTLSKIKTKKYYDE